MECHRRIESDDLYSRYESLLYITDEITDARSIDASGQCATLNEINMLVLLLKVIIYKLNINGKEKYVLKFSG